MESKICSKLVLNTSLFYPLSTGSVAGVSTPDTTMGTADAVRVNCTFTQLDWRKIIGRQLWDNYDEFNLVLVSATYMSAGGTSFGASTFNNAVLFKMSGLNWVNQAYDVYTKSVSQEAVFCCSSLLSGSQNLCTFNSLTFSKPTDSTVRDIEIKLYRASDGTQNISGVDRPAVFTYVFNIYGVEKIKQIV